jgi:hypothetical protein
VIGLVISDAATGDAAEKETEAGLTAGSTSIEATGVTVGLIIASAIGVEAGVVIEFSEYKE